jgi:uncharacterized membrane protein
MFETRADKIAGLAVAFYMGMALFTYGHALNSICVDTKSEKIDCLVGASFASPAIAAFWPLYWSYKLQEQTK